MSRYADRVAAPPVKSGPPRAAAPQPRPAPPPRSPLSHVLQLRAAQSARAEAVEAAPTRAGLPAGLKAGVERLSGIAMDDVRVHRNSPEPARLGAYAYAQGSDIHLGPGQEQHLPHEAWHVVQQKQGRVRPTLQAKGAMINDSAALEAEADKMGQRASAHSGAAGPTPDVDALCASGPVQLKKLIPSEKGCATAVQGSDVTGVGKDQPKMWSFTLTPSEQNPLANRDAALARASEIYSTVGTDTAGGYYMTRFNIDANRSWFLNSNKIFVPSWQAIDLNHYRNVASYDAIDPFVLTTTIQYSHKEKDTAQAKKCSLTLRTQFAHEFTGYITGVKDDELGIDDSMAKRNRFDPNLDYTPARPASAIYSNKHHESGTKSVKDLLPAVKTIAATGREAGVDAITKLVAEGGRFEAVKAMGTALSDETVFYTAVLVDKATKYWGVKFSDLWLCWAESFGKNYNVPVATLKQKIAAQDVKHPKRGSLVLNYTGAFPQGAEHFDLDAQKKGVPVVVAPAPQPAPQQSTVVVTKPEQQPKATTTAKPQDNKSAQK